MKRIGEVFELPLIAIDEGLECGKVKELLISPDNGKVEYLIIDDGQWYLGAKLLPFDKVIGMGVDAVTTDTRSNIKSFGEVEEAVELASKNVRLLGAKCYTQKGKFVGTVKEYYINEEDGMITGCEVDAQGISKNVPASSVVTYGKDVLVVTDNIEDTLVSDLKKESDEPVIGYNEPNNENEDAIRYTSASNLFEQRQIQILLGRKASKRIEDEQGNVLIDKGQLVTQEIVNRIKAHGKLVELFMNTRS